MEKKFWNIPNVLSLIRLALVPAMLLCFFLIPGPNHFVAMIMFVAASLTDVLDGFIARKTQQITSYGVVLDPLADKLLKISTLVAFAVEGIIPYWLMGVLIFIDAGMIITGICLFKQKITIPSNFFGKLGTVVVSCGLLMCFFDGALNPWNLYILYIGLIIVVASLLIYILLNYKRVFFPNKIKEAEEGLEDLENDSVAEENEAEQNEQLDIEKGDLDNIENTEENDDIGEEPKEESADEQNTK